MIDLSSEIPENKIGDFAIVRYQIDRMESAISMFSGGGAYYAAPGDYVKLVQRNRIWMSNTRHEIRSSSQIRYHAYGRVLIVGLGLGLVLGDVCSRKEVESVLVVEKFQEVIDLVAPTYLAKYGDKLKVVQGDIWEWTPGEQKFDTIFFDIWEDVCTDNYESMKTLHKRGRKWWSKDYRGFVSSWTFKELKRMIAQEKREEKLRGIFRTLAERAFS